MFLSGGTVFASYVSVQVFLDSGKLGRKDEPTLMYFWDVQLTREKISVMSFKYNSLLK